MSEEETVLLFSEWQIHTKNSSTSPLVVTRLLHLCGKEDALPFAVWGGDSLQLQEVKKNLNLEGGREMKS